MHQKLKDKMKSSFWCPATIHSYFGFISRHAALAFMQVLLRILTFRGDTCFEEEEVDPEEE